VIKKIKEFIEAFKDAYNAININKFNAKNAIEEYSDEVDDIVYAADSLKIILARLEAVYSNFPINERQDFIQKTIDLLKYGRRDANGELKDICGWIEIYRLKAEGAKNQLSYLKKIYGDGKYDEVIAKAEEYSNCLEEFYILYGIEENPSENNE
jgi:hypothetical protein